MLRIHKAEAGFKADPRWKIGICLGKTELQDNWIFGDGNRVFLSRSLRRVANLRKEYLSCFQAFTAYSWEYQQNFGGRIVPSKRLASMVGAQQKVPFAEIAVDDRDGRDVIAFGRSFATGGETQ